MASYNRKSFGYVYKWSEKPGFVINSDRKRTNRPTCSITNDMINSYVYDQSLNNGVLVRLPYTDCGYFE